MDRHRTKLKHLSQYKKEGFVGIDADLATSLYEYGLMWGQNKFCDPDEYLFIYGVEVTPDEDNGFVYNQFSYSYMTRKDWEELVSEEWFDITRVIVACGISDIAKFNAGFPHAVFDAIAYYGYENIFGSTYDTARPIPE